MDDETRERIEALEKRVATLQDYDITAQAALFRITEIGKRLAHLEVAMVTPEVNYSRIECRVKEIEDRLRNYLRQLHEISDS